MINNNKILTVSYGTFSCTLEGFDDSFGTMKAIAEYFRDLASDDRYFGAEPPQPDAEMLARIAEREISRRVEAREDEGRIVLSAGEAEVAPAPAAAALAPVVVPTPAPEAADAEPQEVEVEADTAETAAAPEDKSEPEVVVEPEVAVEAEVAVDDDAIAVDAPAVEEIAPEPVMPDTVADAEDRTEAVDIEDSAEAFFADVAEDTTPELTAEDANDVVEDAATLAPDSIAAKLQRIRAVVSQHQDDEDDDAMFEDEHAEDLAPAQDDPDAVDDDQTDVVAETADAIEAAQSAEDEVDEADAEDEDDLSAILARFDADDEQDAVEEDEVTQEVDLASETPVLSGETSDDADDDLGLDSLAALMARDEEDAPVSSEADAEADENLFEDSVEASDPELDAPAPRRARVIKVKRAEIEAAIAEGQIEEVAGEEDTAVSTLSDEDEAELLADLAQVEAELPTDAQDATFEDGLDDEGDDLADDSVEAAEADVEVEVEAETDADADAANDDDDEIKVNDDDVSRLMAEADNQMDEPEGSSRRNAFAHLKAAVAAKKADAGIGSKDDEEEGAFRSDLASVVKPRRPAARSTRGERPSAERPAPLKLVAEQRVDVDVEAAPKGPVRPRRVAAVQEVTPEVEDEGSFADYATDMGAHTLPDLLEAAASYLSFVEGRDQFSRPQLMNKVRQVEERDFSREDGLRSFGQLLRAGKIEKIKGGRFAVTDDIGYRPDQRAAG